MRKALWLFLACGGSAGFAASSVARGNELYHRSCTMCHGMSGDVGDRAPALTGTRRFLRRSPQDLFAAIRHGIPGTAMPPTTLPDADVHAIVAYIRSLRATAAETPPPGDAAAGARVFQAECARCHTVAGRGGHLGPDLSGVGGERSLRALREALTKPKPPSRGYQAARVTTADGRTLNAIVKNENNYSLQLLETDDARLHLLLRDEVRGVEYQKDSLMPSGYDKKLPPADFRNLLSYLSRLARRSE